MQKKIILASGSPRRKEILEEFEIPFEIDKSDCEEIIHEGLDNDSIVCDIAMQKARDVYNRRKDMPILACDTLVFFENEIYQKPVDKDDVIKTLKSLSGQTHQVISGVCIVYGDRVITFSETTDVTFKELSEKDILDYEATKEPYGKAGSYAIQGSGNELIDHIDGSMYNVIGLPIEQLIQILHELEEQDDER